MSEQNENGNVNPLHEDFINSAPENLREAAAELAPVWDSYVQGKFTEAAEYRKQWEPYEELPLDKVTAEDIEDYLAFKELSSDPIKLKAWHEQWDSALHQQHPELFEEGVYEGEYTNDPALIQRLEALETRFQSEDQTKAQENAVAYVNGQLEEIKKDYPSLTPEDEDAICALANKYVKPGEAPPEDFIKQGFKDFQNIVGRTERDLFKTKESQPSPAQHGGRPSTSPTPITDFAAANEAARRAVIESMRS